MTSDLQSLIRRLEPAAAAMLGTRRVYIIAASRVAEPWRTAGRRTFALTGSHLDLALQPYLPTWRGRGCCVLLGDEAIGEYVAALAAGRPGANQSRLLRSEIGAAVAHEIGHCAAAGWRFDDVPSAAAELASAASEAWAEAEYAPAATMPTPWIDHDSGWLRLAMHAAHRLAAPLELHAAPSIDTAPYGLASPSKYVRALGDERARLAGLTLRDVAATPAPTAFTRLWENDVRAWFASLDAPDETQVSALVEGLNIFPNPKREESDMITELVNRIRSRRETARERLLSLARRVAAAEEPAVDEIDRTLYDANTTPDDFGELVERCAERRRCADLVSKEPELRRRLADRQKQIGKHDDKLAKAERARDEAVWPLETESEEIVARLAECSDAQRRLEQVVVDSEAAEERRRLQAERARLARAIEELRTGAGAARHQAAELDREAKQPLDSRAGEKAADAVALKRRAESLDGRVAKLQERFDALAGEIEPLERRLSIV